MQGSCLNMIKRDMYGMLFAYLFQDMRARKKQMDGGSTKLVKRRTKSERLRNKMPERETRFQKGNHDAVNDM